MLPVILSLAGETLSDGERDLFRESGPAGFILFGRNCRNRAQLRALTDSLRDLTGRDDLPILIDQEGGRVARLAPPEWADFPAPSRFSKLYEKAPISGIEAARVNAEAMAIVLAEVGVNVNCAPMLDVAQSGAHDIIASRNFGAEPMQIAALGRAMLDGMEAGGCVGVIKHMPGHGRALTDSHLELPIVDADADALQADLAPFRALRNAPIGMTAHVLYPAWDPERPATTSPKVIGEIIRGQIGFDGLLISDDIGMSALAGPLPERASLCLDAGCDLALHCSGVLDESLAIVTGLSEISGEAAERLARAMARAGKSSSHSFETLAAKRDALLVYA